MRVFISNILQITFIFMIVTCLHPETAFAQWSVGVEAGVNKNYLVTNNANQDFTNYRPLKSFNVGVPVLYTINNWLAIEADPSFVQKNYRQVRSTFYQGVYQDNLNSYIQLPLMAHGMFGTGRVKGFVNGGLYAGYWITGTVKGRLANILDPVDDPTTSGSIFSYLNGSTYNEKYSFDKTRDNRFEAGWVAGAGISYQLKPAFQVFAEARYQYSFTDQQKQYMTNQVPRYNSTYGINIGVLYSISNNTMFP
jgi:hypothetical protein